MNLKRIFLKMFFLSAVLILFVTCNDPVFYTISQEMKPVSPLIPGSPSNIVKFNDFIYVAQSRNLWRYDSEWHNDRQSDFMLQLATDGIKYLYILFYQDSRSSTRKFIRVLDEYGNFSDEFRIDGKTIESIYYAGDYLFIGTRTLEGNTWHYNVYSAKFDGSELICNPITGLDINITGAVHDGTDYFISASTREIRGGIFKLDSMATTATLIGEHSDFVGIIETFQGKFVAIRRSGTLHGVNASRISGILGGYAGSATGALAIWEDINTGARLLLAGRTFLNAGVSTGYTYGYHEIELDDATEFGIKDAAVFREPGRITPSSVYGGHARYVSTIGKQPVKSIFQVPHTIDPEMTLFASTQRRGLWSYRDRGGVSHWNAEH